MGLHQRPLPPARTGSVSVGQLSHGTVCIYQAVTRTMKMRQSAANNFGYCRMNETRAGGRSFGSSFASKCKLRSFRGARAKQAFNALPLIFQETRPLSVPSRFVSNEGWESRLHTRLRCRLRL